MAAAEEQTRLQIGHVLFIDTVGYSKLLVNQQSELLRELNEVVSSTNEFREAEAEGKLIRLPTGDGMALVFRTDPEAPAQCALEIARALKEHPRIALRMGIHSGPVNEVVDVNQRQNIAGAGINMAQRVMDCGDAGHILVSKHVAEDLEQHEQWRPLLHDLGTCEVKHGVRIGIANLYDSEVGNAQLPKKLKAVKRLRTQVRWAAVAVALLVLGAIVGGQFLFLRRPIRSVSGIVEKSIAVLPFENLSEEKANGFFAEGVQDQILTNLAQIADLKVISRTSVMQYKSDAPRNLRKIGEELGVARVVEGSVQRAANKIRVNAQLIDARNDAHLWAQTYDRDLADVFAIQSEIAQSIANELQAKISPSEKAAIEEQPTKDLAAYDLYARATGLIDRAAYGGDERKDFFQAVDLLNQAVARDPSFLLAYCRLAEGHDALYFHDVDRTPNRLALAKAAIDAAFRLKPDSGEAHLALAAHLYFGYFDYDRARDELTIALRTLPNNARIFEWSAYIDRRENRWHDAVRNVERAVELDPRNVRILADAAVTYRFKRDYGQFRKIIDRLTTLEPNDIGSPLWRAWVDVWERGDLRPVQAVVEKNFTAYGPLRFGIALWGRNPVAADYALAATTDGTVEELRGGGVVRFSRAYAEGLVAQMKGDYDKARAAFSLARTEQEKVVRTQADDITNSRALCLLGLIDAALGRKQEAISEGRQAVELVPITKNALDGADILYSYAAICAQVGERDLAIEQLKTLAQIPAGATYGDLRLDPFWDPLRGDPRFEKIVASLAPKDAASPSK